MLDAQEAISALVICLAWCPRGYIGTLYLFLPDASDAILAPFCLFLPDAPEAIMTHLHVFLSNASEAISILFFILAWRLRHYIGTFYFSCLTPLRLYRHPFICSAWHLYGYTTCFICFSPGACVAIWLVLFAFTWYL